MRKEDVVELVKRIPLTDHSKLMLTLRCGSAINIDVVFRTEPDYLVVRGRESGTTDDNRAFFVPYGEIAFVKLERSVKMSDLRQMYGLPVGADEDEGPVDPTATATTPIPAGTQTPAPAEAPSPPMDPAAIAKQNLLERIRAARTSAGLR